MFTNFYVVNKKIAESILDKQKDNSNTVVVSIHTPGDQKLNLSHIKNLYQLSFHDVDSFTSGKVYKPISDTQAKALVDFLMSFWKSDNEYTLIIHCDAGQSRSAAVGLFVMDYITKKPGHWLHGIHHYNRLVYKKLANVFMH